VAFTEGRVHLVRTTATRARDPLATSFLGRWIRQTLAGFDKTLATDFNPQTVFITGSGLDGSQVEQTLTEDLGIPVNRVDLIQHAASGIKNKPSQPWEPHLMDNALALALSEGSGAALLNFRRGPFSVSKHWVENKKSIITSASLLALVLILLLSSVILDTVNLQKRMTALDQEIHTIFKSNFPEVKNIVDPLHQMRVRIEETQQSDLIPGEFGSNIRKLDILNDISRLIPESIDVEIVSVVIGEDNVVLSGNTDTFNAVDDMKSRVEKSKLIQSVTISSANLNRAGNRVRFKLKAQL
jgi:Tfp pilus assembly protein PilN